MVAIVVYAFLWFAAITVTSVLTLSNECSLREVCTEGEKALQSLIGFVLMGGWAGCIILGWKGMLWGARPQTEVGEER